jgi:hypothetical protein
MLVVQDLEIWAISFLVLNQIFGIDAVSHDSLSLIVIN